MDEWKIGYLAGMLDGEGSICISKGKVYSYSVTIGNCHLATLEFLQKEFGGIIYKKPTTYNRQGYMLRWAGNKGKDILNLVSGKLNVKKQVAELYLLFPLGKGRGTIRHTEEDLKLREAIYLKIKELNKTVGLTIEIGELEEVTEDA